jgi:enoyl-CoA hydratase/carnithine racemase
MEAIRATSMEPAYFSTYRSPMLTRNAQGVLVGEFHSGGAPLIFRAQDHAEFVEAFYRISQDRGNKVVILTGTGTEFIPDIDRSSFGSVGDPAVWSRVHNEGTKILANLANIRVPVIAAIEGRAYVHSEYALPADVIVAEKARPSMTCHTSQVASFPATGSSRHGVTGRAPEEPKRSY